MTFERFSEEFLLGLNERGLEVTTKKITKVNEELTAIMLKEPDDVIAATPYLEKLHHAFETGADMNQLLDDTQYTMKNISLGLNDIPDLNADIARQRLYCVLINKEKNQKLLENVPHQDINDLCLIPKFRLLENASFIVHNNICGHLKLTSDEVLEIAKENTFSSEYCFRPIAEVMHEVMLDKGMPIESVNNLEHLNAEQCPMYILTNKEATNGATMMASKDILQDIYNQFGENFHIIPSSLHEVIVIPESFVDDAAILREIVFDVNSNVVPKEDILSDNVYYYNGYDKSLSIIGNDKENEKGTEKQDVKSPAVKGR